MFSETLCDSLPPCTLSLIDSLLQSHFVSEEIFCELIDDLRLLNTNCWRILTRAKAQESSPEGESSTTLDTLFYPLLQVVCRECCRMEPTMSMEALGLLNVLYRIYISIDHLNG